MTQGINFLPRTYAKGNAKVLKDLLSALLPITDEGRVIFTPDLVKVRSMDPARVALINLEIQKSAFKEYACSQETEMIVNVAYLAGWMKKFPADGDMSIILERESANSFPMNTFVVTTEGRVAELSLPNLDSMEAPPPIPRVQLTCKFKTLSSTMGDILEKMSYLSAIAIFFEAGSEKVELKAIEPKIARSSLKVELKKGTEDLLSLTSNSTNLIRGAYSTTYLLSIFKNLEPICDMVTIEYGEQLPMHLKFDTAFPGLCEYWLSPRKMDED